MIACDGLSTSRRRLPNSRRSVIANSMRTSCPSRFRPYSINFMVNAWPSFMLQAASIPHQNRLPPFRIAGPKRIYPTPPNLMDNAFIAPPESSRQPCSNDAMSDVIEREALMSPARRTAGSAARGLANQCLARAAYRSRVEARGVEKPSGGSTGDSRRTARPARRRRTCQRSETPPGAEPLKLTITGRGGPRRHAPFTRRNFAGANHRVPLSVLA